MIAGVEPIPVSGIKKPSKAKLGIACTKFANPITALASFLWLVINIPRGTPIHTATNTAIIVNSICSNKRASISPFLTARLDKKSFINYPLPVLYIDCLVLKSSYFLLLILKACHYHYKLVDSLSLGY